MTTTTAPARPSRSEQSLAWDKRGPRPYKDTPAKNVRKRWVWDTQIQDWLPRNRPCDYCPVTVEQGYTCDPCCDLLFNYWEQVLSDRQATDLLLVAGIKNRTDVLLETTWKDEKKFKQTKKIDGSRMMKVLNKLKEQG